MKKLLLFFLLTILPFAKLPNYVYAQSTTTPNLGMTLPEAEPGTWGVDINNNFIILDNKFPGGQNGHRIREEGVNLPPRSNMNFIGAGVTATDNVGTDSTDVTISITGAGHTIKDEGGAGLTQRPNLNFTGGGVTCIDNGGQNATVCDIPAGSVNVASTFAWTGANSWRSNNWSLLDSADISKILKWDLSGFTTGTTRTWSGPDATTRLIGDSDFGTGIMTRTGANAYAGRTLQVATNELTVTNPAGTAGNPLLGLGSLAMRKDQSATITAGDFDFSNAASLTVKRAAGAAPTGFGQIAYNNTTNHFVAGNGTVTKGLPFSDEVQPLNSSLTSFSGLTGANAAIPYFTGTTTFSTTLLGLCTDSAGQHVNISSLSPLTFTCGTSSTGGLTGATSGKFLIATSATTFDTSGNLSQSAGVINASGGFTVGDPTTNSLDWDTSGITGHKTWTALNQAGTIRPSTGVFTSGNIVKTDVNGLFVDGGAAGTGTWTDSSSNTGTNKTLVATGAGGTNTLTIPLRAFFDASSLTLPSGTTCTLGAVAAINSGPSTAAVNCTDAGTSTFEGQLTLPQDIATVTFTLTVNDVDSSSQHFAGDFSAMCRNNGTTVNSTWGTSQSVDITMVTASNNYTGTTAAVTANGTCNSGATLFWRFIVNTTPFTDGGNARVLGVLLKQAS